MKGVGTTIVRKAGRPKKIKPQEESVPLAEPVKQEEPVKSALKECKGNTGTETSSTGGFKVAEIRGGKMPVFVYRGKEYIKPQENHFFCNGNEAVGYKLIRVYLSPTGQPHRSLEKTLKPRKRTLRGSADRSLLKKLKSIGIQGIL